MKLIQFFEAEKPEIYKAYDIAQKEISTHPHYQDEDSRKIFDSITKKIEKSGLQLMGRGESANVYGRAGLNSVIKVIRPWNNECVNQYLKLARRMNTNKHFPKVYRIKKFAIPNHADTVLVAQIEVLEELDFYRIRLTKNKEYNFGFILFLIRAVSHVDFEELKNDYPDLQWPGDKFLVNALYENGIIFEFIEQNKKYYDIQVERTIPNMLHALSSMEISKIDKRLYQWISSFDTPFTKAIKMIDDLANHTPECGVDLHPDNLMMRSDGTLVFSDPLAE